MKATYRLVWGIRAIKTIAMFMGWEPWRVVYGFKRYKK